jgi:hypothetical protein
VTLAALSFYLIYSLRVRHVYLKKLKDEGVIPEEKVKSKDLGNETST